MIKIKIITLIAVLILQGCASSPTKHKSGSGKSRTSSSADADSDGPPLVDRDVSHIPDASPKIEPMSRYGNPPIYSALGKSYKVKTTSEGYRAEGTASWYGRKFHGQRTSSGEPYDMFGMTAAHRNLPLPTYATVENLANGKEVIVKINDRGPFVNDRIIDLSYAAAKKLGIHATGTGKVRVTAIDPIAWHKQQKTLAKGKGTGKSSGKKATQLAKASTGKKSNTNKQMYIQLGAFNEKNNAQKLADKASTLTQALNNVDVHVTPHQAAKKSVYKVRVGPLKDKAEAQKLQKKLVALNKQAPAKIIYE